MNLTLQSPAKLNLFLKVLNKRSDGFHNIKTIFERIDLSDEMHFALNRKGTIRIFCGHRDVPTGPKNLAFQVAELLKNDFHVKRGVDITIGKHIPVAAGLGGGSSNAATALKGLNRLWRLGLKRSELISYARKIGSDVPFFLYDCSWALGRQRGDQIRKLNFQRKFWHVLVVPRVKLYAGRVYENLRLGPASSDSSHIRSPNRIQKAFQQKKGGCTNMLTKQWDNATILIHNLKKNNIDKAGGLMINDLEPAIFELCPKLLKLKEKLKLLNAKGVMISGSGPTAFGLIKTEQEANSTRSILSKRYSQVFVVRTL